MLGHVPNLKHFSNNLPDNLKQFDQVISEVRNLINKGRLNCLAESIKNVPQQAFLNLKGKKRHEFLQITSLLENQGLLPSKDTVVDYCGGAGYFARNLAYYFKTEAVSVDVDENLQLRGKERNKKFIPSGAKHFGIQTIDLLSTPENIHQVAKSGSPFIGIHACGHLLDQMFSTAISQSAKWIMGIGCCYYKTTQYQYALSNFVKNFPLQTTVECLVSASRGHDVSVDNFKFSLKVKRHRYLLHIFLKDQLGYDFMPVGNCEKSFYEGDFVSYAINRISEIFDQDFAKSQEHQLRELVRLDNAKIEVERMLRCNFIRVHFGKLIEYAIVFDRALYLIENGYRVSIFEIFDPKVSPRNLAILGVRQ